MISMFIYSLTCIITSLPFNATEPFILWICLLSIHPSVDNYSSCFCFLNYKQWLCLLFYVSLWMLTTISGYKLLCEHMLLIQVVSQWLILEKLAIGFRVSCTSWHSYQPCIRVPVSSHPFRHWYWLTSPSQPS